MVVFINIVDIYFQSQMSMQHKLKNDVIISQTIECYSFFCLSMLNQGFTCLDNTQTSIFFGRKSIYKVYISGQLADKKLLNFSGKLRIFVCYQNQKNHIFISLFQQLLPMARSHIFLCEHNCYMSWSQRRHVRVSVCLSVCLRHLMQFFLGLSLAMRSHDQFQASHWSSLPPSLGNLETWKLDNLETRKKSKLK